MWISRGPGQLEDQGSHPQSKIHLYSQKKAGKEWPQMGQFRDQGLIKVNPISLPEKKLRHDVCLITGVLLTLLISYIIKTKHPRSSIQSSLCRHSSNILTENSGIIFCPSFSDPILYGRLYYVMHAHIMRVSASPKKGFSYP